MANHKLLQIIVEANLRKLSLSILRLQQFSSIYIFVASDFYDLLKL